MAQDIFEFHKHLTKTNIASLLRLLKYRRKLPRPMPGLHCCISALVKVLHGVAEKLFHLVQRLSVPSKKTVFPDSSYHYSLACKFSRYFRDKIDKLWEVSDCSNSFYSLYILPVSCLSQFSEFTC